MQVIKSQISNLKSQKSGFTLMELIIAMAILAIVTGSLLGNYTSSQKKGRDSQRKSDLKQLQNALEAYANDHNGRYPDVNSGRITACPGNLDVSETDGTSCVWGSGEFKLSDGTTDGALYMKQMVKDPVTGKNYYYVAGTGNLSYQLYACLENTQDLCFTSGSTKCNSSGFTGTNCGACVGALCNYGVSSSNATP